MWQTVKNIYDLGIKELRGLLGDWLMLLLIIYSFTMAIYVTANAYPDSLTNAAVAIVDEDNSQLTKRITDALMPPYFTPPVSISYGEIDAGMDSGLFTFVLVFPVNFQKDVLGGNSPEIQLNVDATRMSQAFTGASYIEQIALKEIAKFTNDSATSLASCVIRNRFNPNLTISWFESVMQLINNITMLAIILTGAALIRERENGTLEHLLVMPVTEFEIIASKIWSMGVAVLISASFSVLVIIKGLMHVPIGGSLLLFICGLALHLFAVTSMGIFLACVAQSMPQLGMLLILVLIPMQMLSGGMTPRESMPEAIQLIMNFAPTTHFVQFSQAILYRGAGFDVVWKPFLWLTGIGAALFTCSLARFRKSVA